MRAFANLFLILFLADGGFSLVDELVPLLLPLEPFTGLRNLLAVTVIALAVPLYFCLGIDRRLPKRVFLPLIAFVYWTVISTWLFPVLAGVRVYGLLLAVTQIMLGMIPLIFFRTSGGRCLTMPPPMFSAPFFSMKNTLLFGAANLVIAPVAVAMLLLTLTDAGIAEKTSGFMRIAPGGIRMIERVYRRDNRTIRLAAMIHVGSREYYEEMVDSLAVGRTIVLVEGVSDKRHLLREQVDYGKMAGFLGLTTQQEFRFRGRFIDEDDLESPRTGSASTGEKPTGGVDILRADVDISSFRPPTILLLNALGKHLRESSSFLKGAMAINSWGEKNITPEMYKTIMDDILHRRNLALLSHLDKALAAYDTVVIPWGALHMKELEAEILKRGFKRQEERERVSIGFFKMFPGRL